MLGRRPPSFSSGRRKRCWSCWTRFFYFESDSPASADYFRFFAGLLALAGFVAFTGFADLVFTVGAGFDAALLAGGAEGGAVLCTTLDPPEGFGTLDCAATGVLETGLAYGAAWAAAERAAASAFAAAARSDASLFAVAFPRSP